MRQRLAIAFLLALVVVGVYTYRSLGPELDPPAGPTPVAPAVFPARGALNAPVTIEEFSDFQCPFCARSVPVLKRLLEEFDGKVRWVFRHFPVVAAHPNAPLIHMASLAAGEQGRFWEMHDISFENRDRVGLEDLLGYAQGIGLEIPAFQRSLRSRELFSRIEADYNEGIQRGVRATPTFFLNGRKLEGAIPYELFRREVERALSESSPASR